MHSSRRDGGQYGAYGQQYHAYQSQAQQPYDPQHERRSSFDYGDDSNLRGPPNGQQPYQAYGQNQHAVQTPDSRFQSYGAHNSPALGVPPPPPTIQTEGYNPANYAVSGQQTTPTVSSPRIAMPSGNYAAAHVPYNPAAYSTSPPSQQGTFYQPYQSPPVSSYSHDQTPPLPPKPPELAQQAISPYPRPQADRRGAISTSMAADSYMPYAPQSPPATYNSYTPPAPPAPPTHGYNVNAYQPYSSALASGPVPQPPEHRRLPSVPQNGTDTFHRPTDSQNSNASWTPRVPGASLPVNQGSSQQSIHATSSATSTGSRPLPPTPSGMDMSNYDQASGDDARAQQDAIMAEIEAQVSGRPPTISRRPVPSRQPTSQSSTNGTRGHSASDSLGISSGPQQAYNSTFGSRPSAVSGPLSGSYHTDSDPEAVAGLEGMQLAEQEDSIRPNRHQSLASLDSRETAVVPQTHLHIADNDDGSDGHYIPYDISEEFDPGYNHPGSPTQSPPFEQRISPMNPGGTNEAVSFPQGDYMLAKEDDELLSPKMTARVDTGGTGGLAEPAARRMSFDDGDEATLVDYIDHRSSTSQSPTKFDSGYPRRTDSGRPLPPTPNSDNFLTPQRHASQQDRLDATGYDSDALTDVRKTNSLSGPAHPSSLAVPGRSVTDAEQRRRHGNRTSFYDMQRDKAAEAFPGPGDIDLPTIPRRRKFAPSKLSSKDYAECSEPWAISGVLAWIKSMTEGETDLTEQPIVDALVGLFTHKVPTMNIVDAEYLGANLVREMVQEAVLVRDEVWLKFSPLRMSGVIYQLTGTGCYSSRVHTTTMQGRCYSRLCMRTLKKIDLGANQLALERKAEDWATFYKLKAEDVEGHDKKEIELQNILHEIVTSEDLFIDQLDVLLVLYRDGLEKNDKNILALTGKQSKFVAEVFDKVPAVKKINEEYLLSRLKYRQQEQGPWVVGFSDIFRDWIRQAKGAFLEYVTGLPNANFKVRQQAEQNVLFKQFLDHVREHPRSKRLDWNTYLKAPITRLQRYGLLLKTVHKAMKVESKEKANLEVAIKEIADVTKECDTKYAEMLRRTDMADLTTKLKLRPGMENVQLNLTHLGRQIIHRGDLTRRGNNNINWVETHAILFDHYMVLAKPTRTKDSTGTVKSEYYDVSKLPIPMDLLVLESADDGTVMKHSVKGIVPLGTTAVAKPTTPGGNELRLARTTTGSQPNGMPPNNRAQSSPTTPGPAIHGTTNTADSENLFYPFRVQHLGKSESYVLYASTPQIRQEWVEKIIFAKRQHAAGLFAQNAEPFKLHVLADTAFAYSHSEYIGPLAPHITGTPLDRALRDVEREHGIAEPRPTPICRSPVNCATAFTPALSDRPMLAVGTDFGVFITQKDNPRGWFKAINAQQVTQIAVLEDFSILLIIADKSLIAFHLDAVCDAHGGTPSKADDNKRTPQKLSGSRDVGFFAVGRMKERMLVFYKKKDGISSTFKVLEPVYHKSNTASSTSSGWSRSRFGLKKGTTEFFRDFDDFYIATETYAINLFASSLGIATSKGIEVLTLDKKVPFSIPELRTPEVQSIALRIKDQLPLGMFRLTDSEFLLVFQEVGIYVDKHGEISRAVVMEFVGKARQAALYHGTHLVLVDDSRGFVEVRNATNGRLRQVIPGRDVKLLDDGMSSGASTNGVQVQAGINRGTIKISMMHPELDRGYVVLEMLVNEDMSDGVRGV